MILSPCDLSFMRKNTMAFSLVETMVVLAIVGVLGSVFVVAMMQGSLGDKVGRATGMIQNDLIAMRMRAISLKNRHRLRFSSTTEWRIEMYLGGSPPTDWQVVGDIRRMPSDTYLTLSTFSNAGANLEVIGNGLYEFQGGMSGDPYVTIDGLGVTRTKSIQVHTGGAIQIVINN